MTRLWTWLMIVALLVAPSGALGVVATTAAVCPEEESACSGASCCANGKMSCCIEESQEQPTQAPADARPGTSTLQPLALFLAVQAEAKLQPPAGLLPQADRPAALVPDQCPRYQRFCALLI